MAWLNGWSKRIEIDIDYTNKISGSVTWFPATIFLKNANGDSTKVFLEIGANSRQIAITKADGDTELKGEIEKWSYDAGTPANSTAVIHTSATGWVINANTSIFLYYHSGHANNANIDVTNTTPAEEVWNDEYILVSHQVDNGGGNITDSTHFDNDLTKASANNPIEAAGKVGLAQDFSSDYLLHSTFIDTMPVDFTMEAIIKPDTIDVYQYIFQKENIFGTDRTLLQIQNDNVIVMWGEAEDGGGKSAKSLGTVTTGTWYYVAGVHTHDAALKVYLDTTEDTGDVLGTISSGTDKDFYIGRDWQNQYPFDGVIDEVRISSVARAATWLKGTKNSLWDDLFTYGSEETEPEEAVDNAIFFGTNL